MNTALVTTSKHAHLKGNICTEFLVIDILVVGQLTLDQIYFITTKQEGNAHMSQKAHMIIDVMESVGEIASKNTKIWAVAKFFSTIFKKFDLDQMILIMSSVGCL